MEIKDMYSKELQSQCKTFCETQHNRYIDDDISVSELYYQQQKFIDTYAGNDNIEDICTFFEYQFVMSYIDINAEIIENSMHNYPVTLATIRGYLRDLWQYAINEYNEKGYSYYSIDYDMINLYFHCKQQKLNYDYKIVRYSPKTGYVIRVEFFYRKHMAYYHHYDYDKIMAIEINTNNHEPLVNKSFLEPSWIYLQKFFNMINEITIKDIITNNLPFEVIS